MAQISVNITENELENTVNWRFLLEYIRTANDRVLTAMKKMELRNIYRKSPEMIHTTIDGQKFEVRTESLNAKRHKVKGKAKGGKLTKTLPIQMLIKILVESCLPLFR